MSDISISSCASDEPPPLVEGDVDCDDEQEREKIQILVDIRTRLLTGHHTAGITHNRRCNVNKQIVSYKVVDGRLYNVKKGVEREVLLDAERKRAVFSEAHIGHPGRNATMANISKAYLWRNVKQEVSSLLDYTVAYTPDNLSCHG